MSFYINISGTYHKKLKNLAQKYGYVRKSKGQEEGCLATFLKAIIDNDIELSLNIHTSRIPTVRSLIKLKFWVVRDLKGTLALIAQVIGNHDCNIIDIRTVVPESTYRYATIYILLSEPKNISITDFLQEFKHFYVKDMRELTVNNKTHQLNSKTEIFEALDSIHYERVLKSHMQTLEKFNPNTTESAIDAAYNSTNDRRLINRVECVFQLRITTHDRPGVAGEILEVIAIHQFHSAGLILSYDKVKKLSILDVPISFTEKYKVDNITDIDKVKESIRSKIRKIDGVTKAQYVNIQSLL